MQISTLYGALLLALTRAVVSQDPNDFSDNCNYASPYPPYRNPEWLCDVCGRDFLRGSAPTVCRPVNATVRLFFLVFDSVSDFFFFRETDKMAPRFPSSSMTFPLVPSATINASTSPTSRRSRTPSLSRHSRSSTPPCRPTSPKSGPVKPARSTTPLIS
jgi:hypothetical protein